MFRSSGISSSDHFRRLSHKIRRTRSIIRSSLPRKALKETRLGRSSPYGFRLLTIAFALVGASLAAETARAATFEYDALGRVVKVVYDDGSYVVYTYDAAGNRTVVTTTKN